MLLGIERQNGSEDCVRVPPEFPPKVFSHDHPRAESGQNRGDARS
jgi:hypothetical protein